MLMAYLRAAEMSEFLCHVQKSDGCWAWTGGKRNTLGYGSYHKDGKKHLAHRVSWVLHRGPIPGDLLVLHHCDNPKCVNPQHLFLGTKLDNARDRDAKGRNRLDGVIQFAVARKNRTHCKRGHPYSGANLYIIPSSGARVCMMCKLTVHAPGYNERRRARRASRAKEQAS